jgi:hypothetical protein
MRGVLLFSLSAPSPLSLSRAHFIHRQPSAFLYAAPSQAPSAADWIIMCGVAAADEGDEQAFAGAVQLRTLPGYILTNHNEHPCMPHQVIGVRDKRLCAPLYAAASH